MIAAVLVLGGVGVLMAGLLAVGKKVFAVEVDPRFEQLMEVLPGANCGGCGYPGCSGYAAALIEGTAPPTSCPPGGEDVPQRIGAILGVAVEASEAKVALIACAGDAESAPARGEYRGVADCRAAHALAGGFKKCAYGCLGLGTCATVCKFDAVRTTAKGLVWIDPEACTGCGACVAVCPRNLISLVPKSAQVHVLCANPEKAKAVKEVCSVGCTGCKLCAKQSKALVVSGALAKVDYTASDIPVDAALACPQQSIFDLRLTTWRGWLEYPAAREAVALRAAEWKQEQKAKKAAAKAKKKADAPTASTEAPAESGGGEA